MRQQQHHYMFNSALHSRKRPSIKDFSLTNNKRKIPWRSPQFVMVKAYNILKASGQTLHLFWKSIKDFSLTNNKRKIPWRSPQFVVTQRITAISLIEIWHHTQVRATFSKLPPTTDAAAAAAAAAAGSRPRCTAASSPLRPAPRCAALPQPLCVTHARGKA